MIALIIFLIIYGLSCWGAYKFIQLSHYHEKGKWEGLVPDALDIFVTFFPLTNTGLTIAYITGCWKDSEYREINFFKFK